MSELSVLSGSKTYDKGKYIIFKRYLSHDCYKAYNLLSVYSKDKKEVIGEFPVYLKDIINKSSLEIEKLIKPKFMDIIEKDKK